MLDKKMNAEIIKSDGNEVGKLATSQAIKKFDTDGSPIQIAGVKCKAKNVVCCSQILLDLADLCNKAVIPPFLWLRVDISKSLTSK